LRRLLFLSGVPGVLDADPAMGVCSESMTFCTGVEIAIASGNGGVETVISGSFSKYAGVLSDGIGADVSKVSFKFELWGITPSILTESSDSLGCNIFVSAGEDVTTSGLISASLCTEGELVTLLRFEGAKEDLFPRLLPVLRAVDGDLCLK